MNMRQCDSRPLLPFSYLRVDLVISDAGRPSIDVDAGLRSGTHWHKSVAGMRPSRTSGRHGDLFCILLHATVRKGVVNCFADKFSCSRCHA
jgi:hypothetical protein